MSQQDGPTVEERTEKPKAKGLCLRWIVILCFAGGSLVLWPYLDDPSLRWHQAHLEVIDNQLQGLKELLLEYKARHGRYPTNDEGFAVLDNFESRFTITWYRPRDEANPQDFSAFPGGNRGQPWWLFSKRALGLFRDKHGRAPRNQEELNEEPFPNWAEFAPIGGQPVTLEIAIDRHDNMFLPDRSGILSPWLLPYIYENRNDCDATAFRGSLADGDRWGVSVRVDEGVHVFSTGGYLYAREVDAMQWARLRPRLLGAILLVIGIGGAIYSAVQTKRLLPTLGIVAIIPGLIVAAYFWIIVITHGGHRAHFSRRDPEMVSLQMELLDKYRENGVISEEAYRNLSTTRE
jgi:hypothetical protein